MKNALVNGLTGGVVISLIFLVINAVSPEFNFSMMGMLFYIVAYIPFMLRASFRERKRMGGYIGFGEVFITSMVTLAVSSFIFTIFTYFIMKDNPELMSIAADSSKDFSRSTMSMMGMSDGDIELELEKQYSKLEGKNIFSMNILLMNWFGGLLFPWLLFAAVVSFFVKKEEPKAV